MGKVNTSLFNFKEDDNIHIKGTNMAMVRAIRKRYTPR
jgi:hypothetical protein